MDRFLTPINHLRRLLTARAEWPARLKETVLFNRLYRLRGTYADDLDCELKAADSSPRHLYHSERRIFSQNGEDGILEEIFSRLGVTNKWFVEIGIGDGTENNTRYLLERKGWSGAWIDADPEQVRRAQERFADLPVNIQCALVEPENVCSLLAKAAVPPDFDLLSLDIDGNDAYVLKALASAYRPRVLAVEYTSAFPSDEEYLQPYEVSLHLGSSLRTLAGTCRELGWILVGCDSLGVNAFFVRQDLVDELFDHAGDVGNLYSRPKHLAFFYDLTMKRRVRGMLDRAALRWVAPPPGRVKTSRLFWVSILAENRTHLVWSSDPPNGVYTEYRWRSGDSATVIPGAAGAIFPPAGKGTHKFFASVVAPARPGTYTLELTLIRDPLYRFGDVMPDCWLTTSVEVVDEAEPS